jgi:hypothetical protein
MDKLVAEIKRNMELYTEVRDAPVGLAFKRDQTWTKLNVRSEVTALVRKSVYAAIETRISRLIKELEELAFNAAADAVYKELEIACPGMFVRK